MRVVLDTNVIISALFFGGSPRKLIERFFNGDFTVFVSPPIVQEYVETYADIHRKYSDRGNPLLLQKVIEKSQVVLPKNDISVCRDKDDDKFISCAVESKCLYIVSGDNDLLSLETVSGVEIVTISDFLKKLEGIKD